MIIKGVDIKKFRGFNNLSFELGKNITVIAGQNGTQKTTLLGMLSQTFSITDSENPLKGEKPLCGGNYRSSFSSKFKLSDTFDLPQNHEWTLRLHDETEPQFTIESIARKDSSGINGIRFWKKGDKSKGSGYIQLPIIYLSLSRLFPIGEDINLGTSNDITLNDSDFIFYKEWHNRILVIPDVEMTSIDYLASKQKNTLGVNTGFYDWKMNSAGQDNIGKILLAILSFKRLQDLHKNNYKGGILVIDEIDATLYPASQIKLIEALRKFSSKFMIQIIFTTHSLNILEKASEWQNDEKIKNQVKILYLLKIDSQVKIKENVTFDEIKDKLNISLASQVQTKKTTIFTEDDEGQIFLKAIIKRRSSELEFNNCSLGCDNLIELCRKKIKGFKFPESLIVLDGDVKSESSKMRQINLLNNIIILPGQKSPERLIAEFLHSLSDESAIWNKIKPGYNKQFVFQNETFADILNNREKAKSWFNTQKQYWGRNCANVINPWIDTNKLEVDSFIEEYDKIIAKFNKYY